MLNLAQLYDVDEITKFTKHNPQITDPRSLYTIEDCEHYHRLYDEN